MNLDASLASPRLARCSRVLYPVRSVHAIVLSLCLLSALDEAPADEVSPAAASSIGAGVGAAAGVVFVFTVFALGTSGVVQPPPEIDVRVFFLSPILLIPALAGVGGAFGQWLGHERGDFVPYALLGGFAGALLGLAVGLLPTIVWLALFPISDISGPPFYAGAVFGNGRGSGGRERGRLPRDVGSRRMSAAVRMVRVSFPDDDTDAC